MVTTGWVNIGPRWPKYAHLAILSVAGLFLANICLNHFGFHIWSELELELELEPKQTCDVFSWCLFAYALFACS